MGSIGKTASSLPDLPEGGRVTRQGVTRVIPTPSQPPAPHAVTLPPVPGHPLLPNGPGAAPAAVHAMLREVTGGRASSVMRKTTPLPGRAFNSTFDAPPVDVQSHVAMLLNLRGVLGTALADMDAALTQGTRLLSLAQEIPGIAALAAKEDIDLVLASTFLEELKKILDKVKPPVPVPAPTPEPTPEPPVQPPVEKPEGS